METSTTDIYTLSLHDALPIFDPAVVQCVRFAQANLLQLDAHAFERFDFILCRNVLIYFDRDTQCAVLRVLDGLLDRKSTRLNSSHMSISYAVFCLKKKIYEQL